MKLFPPQQAVVDSGILESNQHCFLSMATGSGKTYLSELAIDFAIKDGYKTLYVTPLRALAMQQHQRWSKRYPNCKIGVFTGETIQHSSSQSSYASAQILIMTPERLDACMRNWRTHWNWIPDLNLVVIDEFHILGLSIRGARLEGTITRLIRMNPFVKILGLSATMPNASELADWLHGTSYSSTWRQVPIQKRIVRFSSAAQKPQLLFEEVARCVKSGGQSLVFCNSRSRVQQITDYIKGKGIPTTCHHAGLTQDVRIDTEQKYKTGKIRVLVATSTLEMGLNLPARQVVIYDSYSFSDTGFIDLPVWSFIQRAGRAGRPGLDENGEVVLLLAKWSGDADRYLDEDCEHTDSQLISCKFMGEQLLIDVYAGYTRTKNELIHGFLPMTLYKHQHPEADITPVLNKMLASGLLKIKDMESSKQELDDDDYMAEEQEENISDEDKRLKVGLIGRLAVRLMFSPDTINLFVRCYNSNKRLYLFDLLLLATLSDDCSPVINANFEELDQLCECVHPIPSKFLDCTVEQFLKKLPDPPGILRLLASIKMSALCYALTKGEKAEDLAKKFDVYEADIHMLKESVVRLLQGMSVICTATDRDHLKEDEVQKKKERMDGVPRISQMLATMLNYGIDSERVSLTQLDGVGGQIARKLSDAGFSSLQSLANISKERLSEIDGVGRKLAESIVKQLPELLAKTDNLIYHEDMQENDGEIKTVKTTIDPYRLRRSMELRIKGHDGGIYRITGGREDHVVRIVKGEHVCDCQDFAKNRRRCKHILCVLHATGNTEVCKMVKKIKENKSHTIREALPTLWFSVTSGER